MASIIKAHGSCSHVSFIRIIELISTRQYAKAVKTIDNKYTETVLLPQTKFPAKLTGAKRVDMDNYLIEKCRFADLYNWQRENRAGPDFVLHDGPPYANGDLHMGHAVNKILKDITTRSRVIRGQRVHYIPGWDCHGLPIELKALKNLTTKTDVLTPLEIRQLARKYAEDAIKNQREAFISWGVMADWKESGCYFTNHTSYMANELRQFNKMYESNLIYRDFKPVYWSPSSRTALAESELEYNDKHESKCATVRFAIVELSEKLKILDNRPIYALTWTTTPWTLIANQALAFSDEITYCVAEDQQKNYHILAEDLLQKVIQRVGPLRPVLTILGSDLAGCRYSHPLNGAIMPFIASSHVTNKLGTGLVHIAPAHGTDDFVACLSNNIPVVSLINEEGCYTSEAGSPFSGLDALTEGNEIILQQLGENVLHTESLIHSYPYDWRTKKPVITRASYQWFINTESIKDKAIEALKTIQMYPKVRESVFAQNLATRVAQRPYWCISRQRAWGTPIPVLYHKASGKVVTNCEFIERLCRLLEKEGSDCWWSLPVEKLLGKKLIEKWNVQPEELVKGEDILDIWFDSGISWSSVLPENKADLYLEGMDQFNGWFQSSLLTSMALQDQPPFKSIFVHGFVVDEKGLKMSKSFGNFTSPDDIIKGKKNKPAYGVDTLRWWVANHGVQHSQIPVVNSTLQNSSETTQKIRSVLKFLLGALHPFDVTENIKPKYFILDRYMLHQLYHFNRRVQQHYDNYEYHNVCKTIINFVVNDVSALYCHLIKDRLYCEKASSPVRVGAVDVIDNILVILTRSIAPILPHLAEEAWLHYPDNLSSVPLHHSDYNLQDEWNAPDIEKVMNSALLIRNCLNKAAITKTLGLHATVRVNKETFSDLNHLQSEEISSTSELCTILQVSELKLIEDSECTKPEIDLKSFEHSICKRCRRYSALVPSELCARCADILNVTQNK